MSQMVRRLLDLIVRYRLDDRSPHIAQLRQLCEWGFIQEDMAETQLYALQPWIQEQERRFNGLHRAPSSEEIYPDKQPDLVIGQLAEDEEVPIALFLDGPAHCIFGGTTGAGKTIALRRLIMAVEEWNHETQQTDFGNCS